MDRLNNYVRWYGISCGILMRLKNLLFILINIPLTVLCQEKINTEQPDQSYGSKVLETSQFQFETSLFYNNIKEEANPLILSSLLRFGLIKETELRLMIEQGNYRDVYITKTAYATYPLALGIKHSIIEEKRKVPGIAVIAYVQLPFTNTDGQNSQWSPSFIAVLEKQLQAVTITLNLGIKEEAYEHNWEYLNTADFKYELSEKVQVFAEYFGQFESHESPVHNIDGGFIFLLNRNWQVHIATGSSLFYHPGYYFINTGFAFKLN